LYQTETTATLSNLRDRSLLMAERFNAMPGMSCQPAEGAMYLFPRIDMPERAVERARKEGKEADVLYALDLLGKSTRNPGLWEECADAVDATGICAVAGSGFGQVKGTYHLRVTALCPGVEDYVGKIEKFHREFMEKWS
jgi:alanine transaminase